VQLPSAQPAADQGYAVVAVTVFFAGRALTFRLVLLESLAQGLLVTVQSHPHVNVEVAADTYISAQQTSWLFVTTATHAPSTHACAVLPLLALMAPQWG
jgi:hypothetical protein